MTRARLDRLAYLAHRALSTPPEARVHTESMIQLVCRALQTAARAHQQIGTAEHQRQATDIAALRRWILEKAGAAGLRIADNRTRR